MGSIPTTPVSPHLPCGFNPHDPRIQNIFPSLVASLFFDAALGAQKKAERFLALRASGEGTEMARGASSARPQLEGFLPCAEMGSIPTTPIVPATIKGSIPTPSGSNTFSQPFCPQIFFGERKEMHVREQIFDALLRRCNSIDSVLQLLIRDQRREIVCRNITLDLIRWLLLAMQPALLSRRFFRRNLCTPSLAHHWNLICRSLALQP